jgi:hypothetical protein
LEEGERGAGEAKVLGDIGRGLQAQFGGFFVE